MSLSLVGEELEVECASGLLVRNSLIVEQVIETNVVIIGAIGRPNGHIDVKPSTLAWLRRQYDQGALLVSICTGAFVLAATGLLDGKKATTHWACENEFKALYPKVKLHISDMFTEDSFLYCSAGASAYQDMSLRLVSKFFGDDIARLCSKAVLFDQDRSGQQRYSSFTPKREHKDELIHSIQNWLDDNFTKRFQITVLSEKACMSERQFKRRFKSATGEAPLSYIQALRINFAKHKLETTDLHVNLISQACSYEDVRFFRQLFKRFTGLSPIEYRRKFSL